MDFSSLTIATALAGLRSGQFTASELTEACLRQIERINPTINAFITAGAEGRELEIREQYTNHPLSTPLITNLPLSGIPIAIKDLIDVAGHPSAAGSPKFFGQQPALKDAAAVEKLQAAGATILGKTNTHEIALGITGINPHTGAVRNPHDTARITGGSSSGSAAAVASGMALGALGTDTGGSIRIPAALCGVVGLKPTFGRVSTRGVLPLSWNLDHVGVIAKTVGDATLLLTAIAGYDPRDPGSVDAPVADYLSDLKSGVRGWKIALPVGAYIDESDAEVLAALRVAAKTFADLGAIVTEVEIPRLREAAAANGTMVVADAAAFHHERLAEHPDWFGADVRERLEKGRAVTSTEYALARRTQTEMRRYFELFFDEYDLLILPTTATTAAPIDGLNSAAYAPRLTHFTAPFNLTGLPALSIPCGFAAAGLPLGLQIISGAWAETKVLQAGHAFEQATDWHMEKPNL
jgi:aspartyl-tRNA(Asn)/glutamyl-tRNA(Gln) amidotransferase subunit A